MSLRRPSCSGAAVCATSALTILAACVPKAEISPATLDALRATHLGYLSGEIVDIEKVAVLDDQDFSYAIEYARATDTVAFSHLGAHQFRLGLWVVGPPAQRVADPEVNPVEFDVESVAISPEGRLVATASRDGSVRFYSREGQAGETCSTHEPLTSIAWHPSGRYLLAGSAKGTVSAISSDGAVLSELRVHDDEIRGVAFAANGVAFTGSWDHSIALIDWEKHDATAANPTLRVARRIKVDSFVNDLSADMRGDFLGVALGDAKAQRSVDVWRREKQGVVEPIREADAGSLFSVSAGTVLARYPVHHGIVSTTGVSPDGLSVASGGWDGKVFVFSYGSNHNPVAEATFGWAVRQVRFSPDGRYLLVASWTPQLPSKTAHSDPSAVVYRIVYRPGVEIREAGSAADPGKVNISAGIGPLMTTPVNTVVD
jgi:dipeptidyl aminopeptidase/acylaminoacyl peptidase